jgi:bifunctional NMN adenylyltransferase/nudix hydrolase
VQDTDEGPALMRPRREIIMQEKTKQYDVGVLVGRFQVHELHEGHRKLLDYVAERHSKVVIVLGLAPVTPSLSNPLDFESRKQMLLEYLPQAIIVYIKDMFDDELWSRKLSALVVDVCVGRQTAVLYGGRDSFIDHYKGPYDTIELMQSEFWSGSAVRKQIARSSARSSADFRAGAIWATSARHPTSFQTVDVAILSEDGQKVLLGRKPNEQQFRFPGGFAEPTSESLEGDARREVMEETAVEISEPQYVGSVLVNDWRFRGEADKIKTVLFKAKYIFGHPTPGDDLEEVRWFDLAGVSDGDLVPAHRPLMAMLWTNLNKKNGAR